MENLDILKYALEHDMINISYVQEQIAMNKRKEVLENHPYSIWEGKDGKWHTYLPDKKKGRVPKKRNTQREIENLILEYWETEENNIFRTRYLKWVERQVNVGVSDNTLSKYESDYKRFFAGDEIENINIIEINEDVISEYITRLLKSKSIPYRALKEMFGMLNGIFKKAIIDKIIKENPCQYIDLAMFRKFCCEPKKKTTKERTISSAEMKKLVKKLENQKSIARYAIELAMYTGMRVGELSGLKWEDIDTVNKVINIRRSEKYNRKKKEYFVAGTKTDKEREFPLTSDMEDLFKRIKKEENKRGKIGEYVFCDADGKRIHARIISEHMRNITMTSEFYGSKSIYAIRRTFNSNLRCMGVSETIASSLLGHSERVNKQNYTYDISSMEEKMQYVKKAKLKDDTLLIP